MIRIATFLLLLSVIVSCQENEKDALPSTDNFVTAKRNGLDWVGSSEIRLDNVTDTLIFFGDVNPSKDEVIIIKIKFEGLGSYALIENQGYYYSTIGGDVIISEYILNPDIEGRFVVSKYDQTEKSIEGSFEMSLNKKWSNPQNNIPVLNFTHGAFKGRIAN